MKGLSKLEPQQIVTYASLLRQCGATKELSEGKRLHCQISRGGYDENTYLGNLLVQMYGQCGSPEDARAVFDKLPQPNVFSWNIMISAYAQNGYLQEARSLFDQMLQRDVVSWSSMITAYAHDGRLQEARSMFDRLPKRNVVAWTSIFGGYAEIGQLEEAKNMFGQMPHRDVVSWNAMVAAYTQNGHIQQSRAMFDRMPVWSVASWNSMIAAHAQNGDVRNARAIFDVMPEQNTVSWNAIVSGYAQNGYPHEARSMFDMMPRRDDSSWNSIFAGYAQKGLLQETRLIFDQMPRKNVISWTTMFQAYATTGKINEAKRMFDNMPQHDAVSWTTMVQAYAQNDNLQEARSTFDRMPHKNVVSWNAMITIYGENAESKNAFEVFQRMDLEGFQADKVTYVTMLHASKGVPTLAGGKLIHASAAESGLELDPMIGTALISMYGKCGSVVDARRVFDHMQDCDLVTWDAIITTYAQNGHGGEAFELFRRMVLEGVQPDDIYFISILSACSHAGLLSDGWQYFVSMNGDYGIEPQADHYVCMIDLLGRAGRLEESENLINNMPFEPDALAWRTLLTATTIHGSMERGERAAESIICLDPQHPAPYVMLFNMHATTLEIRLQQLNTFSMR